MSRVNVVEAGADPKGDDPIDDILDTHVESNTELYFPEGTYQLGSFATDRDNIQFKGDNATLVPTNRQSMSNWIELHSDGFVMDGFEWDIRNCDYPPRFHIWGDNWTVRNISVRGHCGTNGKNMDIHGVSYIRGWVTDEDGEGLFQNIYLPDGSGPAGARTNRRGFLIEGAEMKGTITFDRVWMEQWGENTIYANNHPGETVIKNSFFRNTNVGLRLGGKTTVENCTFIRDYSVPLQRQGWSGGALMRGIRIEGDDDYAYPGTISIEDCDFVFKRPGGWQDGDDPWNSRPPITWKAPVERTVVKDCRIRYDGYHGWVIDRGSNLSKGKDQKYLEVSNVDIDHRGWRDYGALGLENEPEELGEISGTIKTPGKACSAKDVKTDLKEGEPTKAAMDAPLDDRPPLGQSPTYSELPDGTRLLVIDASDVGRVDYDLSVSGELYKTPEWGASVDREDKLDGGSVSGWADNWLDAYRFSGEIQSISFEVQSSEFSKPTLYLSDESGKASEVTVSELRNDHLEPDKTPNDVSGDESQAFLKALYAFLYNFFNR